MPVLQETAWPGWSASRCRGSVCSATPSTRHRGCNQEEQVDRWLGANNMHFCTPFFGCRLSTWGQATVYFPIGDNFNVFLMLFANLYLEYSENQLC